MRWLRSILAVFLLSGLGVLTAVSPACACSCRDVSAAEAFDLADVVFVGRVVEIHEPAGIILRSTDPVAVDFEVTEVFKGTVPANARVSTPQSSASCGFEPTEGSRYLIYATEDETRGLSTTLCDRNQLLPAAGPVPVELVPVAGQAPAPAVDYPDDRRWVPYAIGGAAAVIVGLGIVIAVRARRRRHATP